MPDPKLWLPALLFILVWSLLHAFTLYIFDYSVADCLTDSIISNFLLASGSFSLSAALAYYRPGNSRYDLIIYWSLGMALLVVFLSIRILDHIFFLHTRILVNLNHTAPIRLGVSFLFITCGSMISAIWSNQQAEKEREARQNESEELKREAELFRLHQQLQPHFIFNSLNSITALVMKQPEEARRMIYLLSDFLRGTMKKEQEFILFSQEKDRLNLYLEIEKVRFGHRLQVVETIGENTLDAIIPALLLQPVLENAIKFSLYSLDGEIVIGLGASIEEQLLVITITNPYDPASGKAEKGTGFGLTAISRRLYLLYGRRDLMQIDNRGGLFSIRFQLPQPKTEIKL